MGTIVVFKQKLGVYPWTIHMLNSSLRKKRRDSSAYSSMQNSCHCQQNSCQNRTPVIKRTPVKGVTSTS